LLDKSAGSGNVEASHRELAFELGTAREVISRHLKDFETRGWVALQRRNIVLQNIREMQALVNGCRA
jgi:CRP/FNR family transcriptional regulator